MKFITHLFFGVFVYLIMTAFGAPSSLIYFAIILVSSLFPDIDSPNSKISNQNIITKGASFVINKTAGHRGIVHSILGATIFGTIVFGISYYLGNWWYGIYAVSGYLAHLISDMFTVAGEALLYPFSKVKFRGIVRTGGFSEVVFLVAILVLCYFLMDDPLHFFSWKLNLADWLKSALWI